jgi:carbon storage regulator
MLYLSRKVGESIIINNTIELTVVEVKGNVAKLGIVFPPDVSVLRKELYEKIRNENLQAAMGDGDSGDMLSAFMEVSDDKDGKKGKP